MRPNAIRGRTSRPSRPATSRRWAFGCSKDGRSPTTTGWTPRPSPWSARRSPGERGPGRPPSASDSAVMASTKDAPYRRGGPVVGVVADVRYRDLRSPSLDVYVPYDQGEFSIGDIVVRTRGS